MNHLFRAAVLCCVAAGTLAAPPASADGTCATKPTANPFHSGGSVVGAGKVDCTSRHDIQVNVIVQRRRSDGTWENRGSVSSQGFNTVSVSATAIAPCQSGTWRTRVTGGTNHHGSLPATNGVPVTVSC